MIQAISPAQLQALLRERPDTVLLDVREDDEVALCALPGHRHIPMNLIPLRHNELPDDVPIVLYCHHGIRSLNSARYLAEAGFDDLYNLSGGIDAWARDIDPEMARY
ncbi:rhodanese-like domain-containing protein [Conchiformibius kuhniae]|uniref:Rhodanese-like domain-containing protein n=1 Tax=Conchiformibius kuhniae TaxID=211502 RepID=A0A8T9MXG3_9NEIS|nr:rhodanese-like domain-containing protein [Conchiformibius kuhniae]UOP05138.1 sulfurtransferase [Conchiformibius kuhniae]